MNDPDEYAIAVEVRHPDAPTVEMRLSWPDEQPAERLIQAANSLAVQATAISARLVEEGADDDV